ncbi:hypothetical protein KA025_03020 [Candidatus Saccharibacteria bacterium]|jgi:hypothetical protein|nr:hypothetical protein [Candidatus Saccharibacteria bacterium]
MKNYLPNKAELATLVFGFGLGISTTMAIDGKLSWMLLFFWPILFIAMPLVYVINKRSQTNTTNKIQDGDN